MDKVYCGKCKWHRFHHSSHPVGIPWDEKKYSPPWDECLHPTNMKMIVHESHVRHYERNCSDAPAALKNENNNCPNYELKLSWWMRLCNYLTR